MELAIIGSGAIGRYVRAEALARGHTIAALLVRQQRVAEADDELRVSSVAALPDTTELVIDCAGHEALVAHGPAVLRRGLPLLTVSLGALADDRTLAALRTAAEAGGTALHLATGAIGALDALRAARVGALDEVRYVGRKPPAGWAGSAAEAVVDLSALRGAPATHYRGTAREAALRYPKNANVAAAVALAGVGFDRTTVELIADPTIDENIHELHAHGDFGRFAFEIRGRALPDNPRSSALAAMSVVSALEQRAGVVHF